jgi:ABC-type histidine transport system ATPase subunit
MGRNAWSERQDAERQSTVNLAVVVDDLHKAFGPLEVLKGVSLKARQGDVVSMIGASGSGKSTFPALHQLPRNADQAAASL